MSEVWRAVPTGVRLEARTMRNAAIVEAMRAVCRYCGHRGELGIETQLTFTNGVSDFQCIDTAACDARDAAKETRVDNDDE